MDLQRWVKYKLDNGVEAVKLTAQMCLTKTGVSQIGCKVGPENAHRPAQKAKNVK